MHTSTNLIMASRRLKLVTIGKPKALNQPNYPSGFIVDKVRSTKYRPGYRSRSKNYIFKNIFIKLDDFGIFKILYLFPIKIADTS